MHISITILTYNSEKTLETTLASLTCFDDIVVLDSGSQDSTEQIARKYPAVRFFQKPFIGFGPMHNMASDLVRYDWVLSIDSDEAITDALVQEIKELHLQSNTVYSIPRKNIYRGKHIKGSGWWPDRVFRLYDRKQTSFSNALVHETIITASMNTRDLKNPMLHTPFFKTAQFIQKIQSYSELYANQHANKKKVLPFSPYLHASFAFFKSYVLKLGIRDGWLGLEISLYNANCALYKYLKLLEKNIVLTKNNTKSEK